MIESKADKRWKARQAASERRQKLKLRAINYKGGCCEICRYDRCAAALEFHHPQEKDFTISNRLTSWERIRRELDRTVLLCVRCHREVHDGLHAGYLDPVEH